LVSGETPPVPGELADTASAPWAAGYNNRNMAKETSRRMNGLLGLLNLHHTARLFLALMLDRRVPLWYKASACCGLVYIFSPLDVVPDFITGIGLLDDIIIALLIMQAFLELAPQAVVEEHCARLHLDPRRLFIDIPRTVQDAIELYEISQRLGSKARPASAPPAAAPAAPYTADQTQSGENEPTPPFTRYSAFRRG
jgi:uncharacterized membrane protein YkvA (DUF1232 family)